MRTFSILAAATLVLSAAGCQRMLPGSSSVHTQTDQYYAVLLSNNSVYFGKMEGLGKPYPVLRDVFYVQGATNPRTKEVSNVLVKRGKEWHGPDRMIINASSIVFLEPVGPDSKVARLIAETPK